MTESSGALRTNCSPEDEPGPWPQEPDIPNDDFLYMRVRNDDVDEDGFPEPRVFRNHQNEHGVWAMSTDWSKYCSPEATRHRTRRRPPAEHGVIMLNVGAVRRIPRQEVIHAPVFHDPEDPEDPNNRGHTNVLGPKSKKDPGGSPEIRARYLALLMTDQHRRGWAIPPPSD